MTKCEVCGRHRKYVGMLLVPVTFVMNYATGEKQTFPAGTIICRDEYRKLDTIGGGSTSEGQQIWFKNCELRRDDGREICKK